MLFFLIVLSVVWQRSRLLFDILVIMIILIDGEKGLELLCVSHEFQNSVNKEARRENLNVNLYAKRYTCEKLRNAGFSDKEIAEILGISIVMVDKLMKNTIDFWFSKWIVPIIKR